MTDDDIYPTLRLKLSFKATTIRGNAHSVNLFIEIEGFDQDMEVIDDIPPSKTRIPVASWNEAVHRFPTIHDLVAHIATMAEWSEYIAEADNVCPQTRGGPEYKPVEVLDIIGAEGLYPHESTPYIEVVAI